mgnify:CR=1 FL=1
MSGSYLDDSGPDYASRAGVVHALCRTAPSRLVWGSDWPHPTESTKPDDARLLDLFGEWIGDSALRQRCLGDADYYFAKSVRYGKKKFDIEHMPAWEPVLSPQVAWAIRTFIENAPKGISPESMAPMAH